jgi:hypothetical protein
MARASTRHEPGGAASSSSASLSLGAPWKEITGQGRQGSGRFGSYPRPATSIVALRDSQDPSDFHSPRAAEFRRGHHQKFKDFRGFPLGSTTGGRPQKNPEYPTIGHRNGNEMATDRSLPGWGKPIGHASGRTRAGPIGHPPPRMGHFVLRFYLQAFRDPTMPTEQGTVCRGRGPVGYQWASNR